MADDISDLPSPHTRSLSSPRSETSSTTDRAPNPLVWARGVSGAMMRPWHSPLGGGASLRFSERLPFLFGVRGWEVAGAFLPEGLEGPLVGALPRAGCCCACASHLLFLLLLRDGEWGCGVGGWLRIGGFEIKSSSMKGCASVAREAATEGGLRTT